MRVRWTAVIAAGLALGPAVRAQHPAPASRQGDEACGVCHGAHRSGDGYLLIGGDWGLPTAGTLGPASRSCLRCHLTASARSRQPEFAGETPLGLAGGKYLGTDLSSGHPLGRPEVGDQTRRMPARPYAPTAIGRSSGRTEIGCPSCHDPHARSGPQLAPEEERRVCAACHDQAAYLLGEHTAARCSGCHDLHGNEPGEGGAGRCRSCHDPGSSVGAGQAVRPMPVGHAATRSGAAQGCAGAGCHRVHR